MISLSRHRPEIGMKTWELQRTWVSKPTFASGRAALYVLLINNDSLPKIPHKFPVHLDLTAGVIEIEGGN